MTARSTRRAALGAILAAPLASVPAAAIAPARGISSELARLIRKSQRADDRVNALLEGEGYPYGPVKAAASLRCRIAKFEAAGLADVLAKAKHTIAIWGHDCAREEQEAATADGSCYLDDMARAVLLDLVRLTGEDAPCA